MPLVIRVSRVCLRKCFGCGIRDEQFLTGYANTLSSVFFIDFAGVCLQPGEVLIELLAPRALPRVRLGR
jgi:hypothetical protein